MTTREAVEYRIYSGNNVDSGIDRGTASELMQQCEEIVQSQVCGYLWQRQEFKLEVVKVSSQLQQKDAANFCLAGKTEFGDNIEDEWLIVYLLRLITKKIRGTVATVSDNDGEFLLIEAAAELDEWLQPDTCENRVLISAGRFHIIPIPQSPSTIGIYPVGTPDILTSIRLVVDPSVSTVAKDAVERILDDKLRAFPQQIWDSIHRARCFVPDRILHAMDNDPQLIAFAVSAFYERDPLDMKAIVPLKYFLPAKRKMGIIKFSRCLYAQVLQQRFEATGSIFGSKPAPHSPDFRAHDLGAKLTIGFEILANKAPPPLDIENTVRECVGPEWERFLGRLKSSGYFRGNIEDSRDWKALLATAKTHFQQKEKSKDIEVSGDDIPYFEIGSNRLHRALGEKRNHTKDEHVEEDSDEWMQLNPSDLDKLLRERWGTNSHPDFATDDDGASAGNVNQAENIINTMQKFVETTSSHEGAEGVDQHEEQFPGLLEDPSDDSESDEGDDNDIVDEGIDGSGLGQRTLGGDGDIEFDSDTFMDSMRNLFGVDDLEAAKPQLVKDSSPDVVHEEKASNTTSTQQEPTSQANKISDFADMMDAELQGTTIPNSFVRVGDDVGGQSEDKDSASANTLANESQVVDDDDDEAEDRPVDLDLNLLENVLKSYSAQQGMAGPVSSMLGSLGLNLPDDSGK